ncbi:hypothetical protein [Rhizobium sp. BT03]|uniref:hypothetical protein n=1 Tax=Rhizobium sp. BT03 TaxID=3045156 RepID=UPI0024B3D500|nr:hypothetical protein [Rhizobium sp. BT03]WHO76065.1 hypothetical protein QMO80_005171 [Rhizobium sp. BT03]
MGSSARSANGRYSADAYEAAVIAYKPILADLEALSARLLPGFAGPCLRDRVGRKLLLKNVRGGMFRVTAELP